MPPCPANPDFSPPPPAPGPAVVAELAAKDITADPIAWFTAERLSLLTVTARCCATGRYEDAARLACILASFQHLQGRLDDAERIWRMIAAAAARDASDPAAAARAQLRLAVAICGQGRHAEASPLVDQCIQAFGHLDDKTAHATAWYWRAVCEWNLGGYVDARQSAERAMRLARAISDRQTEFLALRLQALAIAAQENLPDRHADAVASAERALALARELGQPSFEQEVLHTVAAVYTLAGRYTDALRLCQEGLGLARDLGVQPAIADWLGMFGDVYHGLGRYGEAAESLRSALPIYRDHFMRRHHGLCLLKMGYAHQAMGDHLAAIRCLQESLDIFSQLQLAHYARRARDTLDASQVMRSATDTGCGTGSGS